MAYVPLTIDRDNLTLMGVPFPNEKALESAAAAIGSNMFEGFVPTPALIKLYQDYAAGKISSSVLPERIKELV